MANIRIGNHSSHDYQVAENIKEATQLTWSDSGKLFFVHTLASNYVINLPKLSEEIVGWQAKFILTSDLAAGTVPAGEIHIIGYGLAADDSDETITAGDNIDDDVIYHVEHSTDPVATAGADFVTIVGGSADELGTSIQVYTDGTYWYMLGLGSTAAMLTATG